MKNGEIKLGKIALFGANGAIGHSIAEALRFAGTGYRVVGRSRKSLEPEFGADPLAEIVEWNQVSGGIFL
jgi:prephenate dehydrogenase